MHPDKLMLTHVIFVDIPDIPHKHIHKPQLFGSRSRGSPTFVSGGMISLAQNLG